MRTGKTRQLRKSRQSSGFALLALVALVAMMSAYYIISSLNRTSSEVVAERNRTNMQVLQEAKAALIAYAASDSQWTGNMNDQPGSLPCPSTDVNGNAGTTCTTNATRIGRLPWNKIGSSQLRDASGELLWYGLSANFRKASGTTVINSDTPGAISVTGTTPATNIVAVIIAPGQALGGQSRTSGGSPSNSYSDFLEGVTTSGAELNFNTAVASDTFNDQLITVTQADIMALVEQTAFAHFQQDIKPSIQAYYTEWGRLPYPSSFTGGPGHPGTNTTSTSASNRLQSAYDGSASMTAGRGLLPINNSVTYPWATGSGAVAITGGIAGGVTVTSCVSVSSPISGWQCTFTITARDLGAGYLSNTTCRSGATNYRYCIVNPAFSVSGNVSNVGLSFATYSPTASMTAGTDVTVKSQTGTTRTMTSQSMSFALQATGDLKFTFGGTHTYTNYKSPPSASPTRVMVVTIPDRGISVRPFTSPTDSTAGWFIKNEWFRQMYYVVSPGYLPGGVGTCTPSCLTVSGLSTSNNRAIVIQAGRSINGSTRPSATLGNYFEGNNATPGGSTGYSYAHTIGASSTTNDRITVVAP